jgi:hypothetical protein
LPRHTAARGDKPLNSGGVSGRALTPDDGGNKIPSQIVAGGILPFWWRREQAVIAGSGGTNAICRREWLLSVFAHNLILVQIIEDAFEPQRRSYMFSRSLEVRAILSSILTSHSPRCVLILSRTKEV